MKKNLWNAVMVVAIAAILLSGVMIAGSVKGGNASLPTSVSSTAAPLTVQAVDSLAATAADKLGSVNIERSGIAYSLTAGSTLKDGDVVETLVGSEITLNAGSSSIRLGQNSEAMLGLDTDGISVLLTRGEAFVTAGDALRFTLIDRELTADSGVFMVSVYSGSGAVSVLEGTAVMDGQSAVAGEAFGILAEAVQKNSLAITSLNDFALTNVRRVGEARKLCFSAPQLDELTAQRDTEMREAVEARRQETAARERIEQQRKANKTALAAAASASAANSNAASAESSERTDSDEDSDSKMSCSIEIRCDSILENMENLAEGKDSYVPASGKILERRTISFSEGDTVFDVLQRACRQDNIQLEYSHSPIYDSYYIEGMNNLYEFDCGGQSGWMYKVNGWFPNYGSSAYTIKDGDVIVWAYVCDGYESGL